MAITVNTKAYNHNGNTSNAATYTGPAHTLAVKDTLTLRTTAPKPTKDFAGVGRQSAKFARTVTLAGGATAEAIVEVTTSLPVGMAEADVDSIRDDMGDFLLLAAADDLFWKQDILH